MPIWAPYRILYGSEWQAIRQRELERAGYKCEDCGVPALLLSVGSIDVFRKLHVSHENHDPWRKRAKLRVRCTPCHNTHDAAHKRDAHYPLCRGRWSNEPVLDLHLAPGVGSQAAETREAGGVSARRRDAPPPDFADELAIIHGLLALRRAGRIGALWIEHGVIRTRTGLFGSPQRLSWADAAEMVAAIAPRKPASSERASTSTRKRTRTA
jgi:hypothetical protein